MIQEGNKGVPKTESLDIPAPDGLVQLDNRRNPTQITDEIKDDYTILIGAYTQTSSKLLNENASAMRHTHKYDHVNFRHVDTLVEQVNDGDELHLASSEA